MWYTAIKTINWVINWYLFGGEGVTTLCQCEDDKYNYYIKYENEKFDIKILFRYKHREGGELIDKYFYIDYWDKDTDWEYHRKVYKNPVKGRELRYTIEKLIEFINLPKFGSSNPKKFVSSMKYVAENCLGKVWFA